MRPLDGVYGVLTVTVGLAAFVVAVRLLVFAMRLQPKKGRQAMMLGGVATLLGLGIVSLFDSVDNLVWHPNIVALPSAWLSVISGAVMTAWFEMFGRHAIERTRFESQLEALATTDPLTGILNRRACLERAEALASAAARYGRPFAVLIIDIDFFKQVNDLHGHETGDNVLQLFASLVKDRLRQVDVFGRMGGEEFLVLMPETSSGGAHIAAERIRKGIEDAVMQCRTTSLSITASIGVVAGVLILEEALRKADAALYQAKHDGRNQVVMADCEAQEEVS